MKVVERVSEKDCLLFDTNTLIHSLATIEKVVDLKLVKLVLFPMIVVKELSGLGFEDKEAFKALQFINKVMRQVEKDENIPCRIVTNTGDLLTNLTLLNMTEKWDLDLHRNILQQLQSHQTSTIRADDVILSTAIQMQRSNHNLSSIDRVILISDDINMRLRAQGLDIPSMDTRQIKLFLANFC